MQLKLTMFLISTLIVAGCTLFYAGCRSSDTGQQTTNTQTSSTEQTSPTPVTSPTPATSPATTLTAQPSTPTADSTEVKPKVDACAMLTSKDIESIQGQAVKETKLSGTSRGGFNVSQCFFTLPTFTNSISLAITQRDDGPGARDPKRFWKDTFHKEKERERGKDRGEKKKEEAPPQKIAGIGDEAFWTASQAAGALYVLKGNSYVRVSVGGAGDQESKLKKSKALARKVIDRL